jgi:hypothetical protein
MQPSENDVSGVLEEAAALWNAVNQEIGKYGKIKEEWKIYSIKTGWCKKILLVSNKEERNILFMYPNEGFFTCVLVYGEKAVQAVQQTDISESILDSILSAKAYKEGRSFNVEIRTPKDFDVLVKLIDIKVQM